MNWLDDCIYHKLYGSKYIFLVLYVDDILFATNDICMLHDTKRFIAQHFEMKNLDDASFVFKFTEIILNVFWAFRKKDILKRYLRDMACMIVSQVTLSWIKEIFSV